MSWSGQLGLGSTLTSQYTPKKLLELESHSTNTKSHKITTGSYHTLLKNNNKLYVWGDDKQGQLGLGGAASQFTPLLHPFFDSSKVDLVSVGCGGYHSIVCVYDKTKSAYFTYAFGRNNEGQLGIDPNTSTLALQPTIVNDLTNKRIDHISCGPNYTVLVTSDNVVYTFGMNDFGQCGQKVGGGVAKPTAIKELSGISGVTHVDSGWGHTLLVANDGDTLITWGSNFHGQCGTGSKGKDPVAVQEVKLKNGARISDISCGSAASIAAVNNTAMIWGSCGDGKLGGNQTEDLKSPTAMDNLPSTIDRVSFGTDHCLATTTDNRLFGWGFGQHGALGTGGTRDQLKVYKTPIEIQSELNQNHKLIDIESSIDTSFAIVQDTTTAT